MAASVRYSIWRGRSLLRIDHVDSTPTRTIEYPLQQSRRFCVTEKLIDVGKPRRPALRDPHYRENDPVTVLQHGRTGEPCGILEQLRSGGGKRVGLAVAQ